MAVRIGGRSMSVASVYRQLDDRQSGGVTVFVGRVRADRGGGREVTSLVYEAHVAVAVRELASLEARARARFGARRVVVWHGLGSLRVGAPSVIIGVAAPHRAQAFAACRFLIDALKARVPIWKADRARPVRRPRPRRGRRSGRSMD